MKEAEYAEGYVNFYRFNKGWQMGLMNDPPSDYDRGVLRYFKVKIRVPDELLCESTDAKLVDDPNDTHPGRMGYEPGADK